MKITDHVGTTHRALTPDAWPAEPASLSGSSMYLYEPLPTTAPEDARPYCCYINTVIFYHRGLDGGYVRDENGDPLKYDEIDSLLRWEDLIERDGVTWEKLGAVVLWQGGRWWKRHQLNRNTRRAARANGEAWRDELPLEMTCRLMSLEWRGRWLDVRLDAEQNHHLQFGYFSGWRLDGHNFRWPWLAAHKGFRRFQVRAFGYGFGIKDSRRHRLMRSECLGTAFGLHFGPYYLKLLAPHTLF